MKLPRRTFLHLAAGAATLSAISRFAWAHEAAGKCVELFRDMLPSLSRVAVLANPVDPFTRSIDRSTASYAIMRRGTPLPRREQWALPLLARGRVLVVDVEVRTKMRRALPPPRRDAGAGRANTWEIYFWPRHPGFDRGLKLRQQPRTDERSRLGSVRRVLRKIEQRRDVELVGAINVAPDDLESRTTLPGMQRNTAMTFAAQRDAVALVDRAVFVVIVSHHQFGLRCRI
jgi:hypothetical protein